MQGRPCVCNLPGCRLCHLAATDPRYQRLWNLPVLPAPPAPSPQPTNGGDAGFTPPRAAPITTLCTHLGQPTGETVQCPTCRGTVQLKLFGCDLHGCCTTTKPVADVRCCTGCADFATTPATAPAADLGALAVTQPGKPLLWQYGVTTVPQRRGNLLPRTLASLRTAGFPRPHLFVDGDGDAASWAREFGLAVSVRAPQIRTYGNWILALQELFIREPRADRYAIFQDDFITYSNLRNYLEACELQPRTYWNLYTFPSNQGLCPKDGNGKDKVGWYRANQLGRGAVALVFNQEAVLALLSHRPLIERPLAATHRAWKSVDGGIVTALNKEGFEEYVHNPSLVQHTGDISSMRNKPHLKAPSFRGEQFDAMELMQ